MLPPGPWIRCNPVASSTAWIGILAINGTILASNGAGSESSTGSSPRARPVVRRAPAAPSPACIHSRLFITSTLTPSETWCGPAHPAGRSQMLSSYPGRPVVAPGARRARRPPRPSAGRKAPIRSDRIGPGHRPPDPGRPPVGSAMTRAGGPSGRREDVRYESLFQKPSKGAPGRSRGASAPRTATDRPTIRSPSRPQPRRGGVAAGSDRRVDPTCCSAVRSRGADAPRLRPIAP